LSQEFIYITITILKNPCLVKYFVGTFFYEIPSRGAAEKKAIDRPTVRIST